jgi:hypothetical protein
MAQLQQKRSVVESSQPTEITAEEAEPFIHEVLIDPQTKIQFGPNLYKG